MPRWLLRGIGTTVAALVALGAAPGAALAAPGDAEVAVIGVPDEKWGEMVTAIVVVGEGEKVTEEEIIAHCRGKIAGYKIPKRVEFRDGLARTATGKIQKFKLRQGFWADAERQIN